VLRSFLNDYCNERLHIFQSLLPEKPTLPEKGPGASLTLPSLPPLTYALGVSPPPRHPTGQPC
jgi:hypothetical protein